MLSRAREQIRESFSLPFGCFALRPEAQQALSRDAASILAAGTDVRIETKLEIVQACECKRLTVYSKLHRFICALVHLRETPNHEDNQSVLLHPVSLSRDN